MQTDTFGLILSFLPPIILILSVVLVYLRGKSRNSRIMNRIANQLEEQNDFIESLTLVNDTVTGRSYMAKLAKPKNSDDPLSNIQRLRIHFNCKSKISA